MIDEKQLAIDPIVPSSVQTNAKVRPCGHDRREATGTDFHRLCPTFET